MNQKGFALLTVILFTVVLMVIIGSVLFFKGNVDIKQSMLIIAGNKAFNLAESGVSVAVARLRVDADDLTTITANLPEGSYTVVLTTPTSPSLVEANSTGIYKGKTRKRLRAEITIESPSDYFAASATDLIIAFGSQLANAKVYGRDLTFYSGSGASTTVKEVYYFNSITGFSNDYLAPGGLMRECIAEPSLPVLDASKMNDYLTYALGGVGGGMITDIDADGKGELGYVGSVGYLAGSTIAPANGNGVYYFNGDVEIRGAISVNNQFIVVANGDIHVTGNITHGANSLVGLISTKNVILDADTQPGNWTVSALMIAPNGEFRAEGTADLDNLTFTGGFLTKRGANLATVFGGTRTYNYEDTSALAHLPLMVYISKWQELPD